MTRNMDGPHHIRQRLRALFRANDPEAIAQVAARVGLSAEELRTYAESPRQYSFDGLAGCVVRKTTKRTGTLVGLYQAEQAGMDPEAGAWVTVCEVHHTCVNHSILSAARSHLPDPTMWCEECRQTISDGDR